MRKKGLKITALVLVLSLLAAVFAFSAFAAETPEITISSGEAKAGEEVSVDVKVKNFKQVAGIQLDIAYGDLVFKNVTSERLTELTKDVDYSADKGHFKIAGTGEVDSSYQMGGVIDTDDEVTLLTLIFTVPSDAEVSTVYDVKFNGTGNTFGDNDEELITVKKTDGKVTVKGDYLKGDVNGDGEVTDADAVYLLNYTLFYDIDPDLYPIEQPVDYDGNGEVTDADAVYLLNYTLFYDIDPDLYPLH